MPNINIYLDEDTNEIIDKEAKNLSITKTDLVVRIIDEYIKNKEGDEK